MAAIANTFQTYQAKGNREDLSDVIYNIAPDETPFMSTIGKGKAKATLHEWQVDSLSDPDEDNAQIEGDDVTTFDEATPTDRIGNYCQISRKTVIISDTQEEVDKAGRKSEIAYQTALRAKELKRDMETIMLANKAAVAGATGTARRSASIQAFLKTNTNFDATTGEDPVYTTVPTDARTDSSVTRAFTEDLLKDVIQKVWTSGGNMDMLLVGAKNKQAASGFAGIAELRTDTSKKTATIVGAADVYVSDFGTLQIVPDRFMRARDALLVDRQFASVAFLRPFKTKPLAKTGDAEKRMLIAEWTLKIHNEAAHGGIYDLTVA